MTSFQTRSLLAVLCLIVAGFMAPTPAYAAPTRPAPAVPSALGDLSDGDVLTVPSQGIPIQHAAGQQCADAPGNPGTNERRTACVELSPSLPISEARIPNPPWCGNGYWALSRVEACAVYDGELILSINGRVTGSLTFTVVDYLYMSLDAPNWRHQAEVDFHTPIGDAAKSTMEGNFTCSSSCIRNSYTFPPYPVTRPGDATGEGSFKTTVSARGTSGWANNFFISAFVTPGYPRTNNLTVESPDMRCDYITPNSPIGCVVPSAALGLIFSRTGLYPEFARHVDAAQASGLPGDYPLGRPLTRLTDQSLIDRNYRTACPRSYGRPPGKQCDEYPFRSTYQGAYTGGGTARTHSWCSISLPAPPSTGPRGFSICMINSTQNAGAGGVLGSFYTDYRYLGGDPFLIEIVP